jgi:hypothetical protein
MKKIKLSLFVLMLSATAFAQVYTDPGNGNVGIGTTSPVAKLDIFTTDNTAAASLFSLRSNFHVAGNYGMIRFGDYTQTTLYQKGAIIYESVWGSARGKFHVAMENTDGPGSVTLADARFTIQSDGNVGIGITAPTEKLSVNGNIRAKEIKVQPTDWPDYVFAEGYRVGTLEELESYIKVNKHLPEMPSAKEVKENGIELGEMNKILLKKIEELTLYIIQLKKESIVQQKQLDLLKKNNKH